MGIGNPFLKKAQLDCYMKINVLLRILTLSIPFVVGCGEAYACECMEKNTPTTEFRKTPVIFVGTVKSEASADDRTFGTELNWYDIRNVFSVTEAIKGVKSREVDVYASSQGTACGIRFYEGENYLVYAYRDEETKKFLSTSICTRTRPATESEDEIGVLRSLSRGRFEPRLYGRVEEVVRGIFLGDRTPNKPFPGIRVIARSEGNTYQTKTDEDGRFRFVGIRPGLYRLDLDLPSTHKVGDDSWGFTKKQKPNLMFTVTAEDSPDFITIETRVDGRIKGRISDSAGKPVGKGIRVTLVTKATADDPDNQIQYIGSDTDSQGFYGFDGIPKGEYLLGINLDVSQPYKDSPFPKSFYPGVAESSGATVIKLGYGEKLSGFDMKLPTRLRSITVRGRVVREDGSPINEMTVYVTNQARHDFEDFVWLKTDRNGEFEASCLEGLTYRFKLYDGKQYNQPLAEKTLQVEGGIPLVDFVIRR